MSLELFSKEFGKGQKAEAVENRRTVIWTRVSTVGQEDNASLKHQREICLNIAVKDGLDIMEEFGKRGESAKAGALRKEFHRMLEFVKKKKNNIRFILFYDHTRFSREGGKAVFIKEELREKYGIITKSAILPLDTEDPYADLIDSQQLLFARAENEKRRRRTKFGLLGKLKEGKWVGTAPFGYYWENGEIKIHPVNGPIVKQAFMWRYHDPATTVTEIRRRLAARGHKLSKNHAHKILHSPFYCGLMAHNLLEGEVVKGNHPPIISQKIFLAVNNVFKTQSGTVGNYSRTQDSLPLKGFLSCQGCGKSLTGYEVKNKAGKPRKRPIPYYKCNYCKVNKSARKLNESFKNALLDLQIDEKLVPLVLKEFQATFAEISKAKAEDVERLKSKKAELEHKKKRLRERFMNEDLNRSEYHEFNGLVQAQIEEIEEELERFGKKLSNLSKSAEEKIQNQPFLAST